MTIKFALNAVFLGALTLLAPTVALSQSESAGDSGRAVPSAPSRTTEPVSKNYVLTANDLIRLEVFQEDDLKAERRIAGDGTVTLPLIGSVKVGGKTVEAASEVIRDTLEKDYLVNPRVTLTVVEHVKRHVTVLGEVQRPGVFPFSGEETISLLEVIAQAGGASPKGNLGKVRVMRAGGQVFMLDVGEMTRNPKAATFNVQPNDTITVPQRVF